MKYNSKSLIIAFATALQNISVHSLEDGTSPLFNRVGANFEESAYRIERAFVPVSATAKVLGDLLNKGIPGAGDEDTTFPVGVLKKIGDAGNSKVDQHDVTDYASVLQAFANPETHLKNEQEKSSLVYYVEKLEGDALVRSKEIVSTVASPSILHEGGTVHL